MKTIVCFGDSITDMSRERESDRKPHCLGYGYPLLLEAELGKRFPNEYSVLNRGIGGHRSVDCAARIKEDVWNLNPDYVVILVGVNDVWHAQSNHGVELPRFARTLLEMVEDTKAALPNAKIILLEPFILHGEATDVDFPLFERVYDYAAKTKEIAEKEGCQFVALQKKFEEAAERYGLGYPLYDGVHPTVNGSRIMMESLMDEVFDPKE